MKQRSSLALVVATFAAIAAVSLPWPVAAARPADLPETAGTYAVPGRSDLKLRVHVYHAKNNAKPSPTAPQLVCGLTDGNSSATVGFTGWKLSSGTTTYRLNPGSLPASISAGEFATLTNNAFNAWRGTDLAPGTTITQGQNTSANRAALDSQNVITWGRTSGSALATTYTWYYSATGFVTEVDTVFNNKFSWEWTNPATDSNCAYKNLYDAQDIMTHELGHWMGLDDHYTADFTNNTMYGYGSPTEVKKNTLTVGDTAAMNALY